jgi:RNA polymerase sigma factor for flagellar operon FliA
MIKCKPKINDDKKEEIIKEFLPYIRYTAYRLSWKLPAHINIDDLISVGLMGLMDAVDRFEPGKVKLKTYAELRIKGAMIDELRATAWIPRSMKKVARLLKMPLGDYYKILQYATSSSPIRLEDFKNNKYADSDLNIAECIADSKAKNPLSLLEEKDNEEKLAELIDTLPEKEKIVLSLYYWEELTMQEIGRVLNITESRVCQIHSQAIPLSNSRQSLSNYSGPHH